MANFGFKFRQTDSKSLPYPLAGRDPKGLVYIYTLSDPNSGTVRYVGSTSHLNNRLLAHIKYSSMEKRGIKGPWIATLIAQSQKPVMEVIDTVASDQVLFWESFWICQLKAWGLPLLNILVGDKSMDKHYKSWNAGTAGMGVMKPNKTSFKKGQRPSVDTEIKPGQRLSPKTEFKKGLVPHNRRAIEQIDLEGRKIEEYESAVAAARAIGVQSSNISKAVRTQGKCMGFYWQLKQEQ